MRNTLPSTFEDFNFEMLETQISFSICRRCRLTLYIFTGFKFPPSCATGGNCLRRFGTLRKNTTWNLGACILWILSMFVDFRVHQVVNSSATLYLYTYLCVLAPPWSYSISEIRNPALNNTTVCSFAYRIDVFPCKP